MPNASSIFFNLTKFYGIPGANAGKKNGRYLHGRWSETNKPPKTKCAKCGSTSNLLYHHKNRNEQDNKRSNIQVLCSACHNKVHMRGYNFSGKKSPMGSVKRVKNGNGYR